MVRLVLREREVGVEQRLCGALFRECERIS
jgi:hypothetical protein